jgi:hypothetical protein
VLSGAVDDCEVLEEPVALREPEADAEPLTPVELVLAGSVLVELVELLDGDELELVLP